MASGRPCITGLVLPPNPLHGALYDNEGNHNPQDKAIKYQSRDEGKTTKNRDVEKSALRHQSHQTLDSPDRVNR